MEVLIVAILITVAAIIIGLRIYRVFLGKGDPCSGCSYKSSCRRGHDKQK